LTITTPDGDARSAAVKGRPAIIGAPSTSKKSSATEADDTSNLGWAVLRAASPSISIRHPG
jgi:hypothetical protein